jgi:hypothetical protein
VRTIARDDAFPVMDQILAIVSVRDHLSALLQRPGRTRLCGHVHVRQTARAALVVPLRSALSAPRDGCRAGRHLCGGQSWSAQIWLAFLWWFRHIVGMTDEVLKLVDWLGSS